jgi:serine/threonine-protein kinase PpkA
MSSEPEKKEVSPMIKAEVPSEHTRPFPSLEIPGYRICGELGCGGMARVYLATQERLERLVALKVLLPSWSSDELVCRRFLKEGRIIAGLDHPHIVTVFDIGVFDQWYYMAMEYIAGGDLRDLIREGVPVARWFDIVRQVATTLAYAHTQGLVHRDVKPGNILFKKDRTIVLSDFGIAKLLGSHSHLTTTGSTFGTPDYMSPEQLAGKAMDSRSDLYSLGIVIYEVLTGHKPFSADDAFATAVAHLNAPIPQLPEELASYQRILERLLAKDPRDRFGSAGQLVEALDKVQTQESCVSDTTELLTSIVAPTSLPGPQSLEQPTKPARKRSSAARKKRWLLSLLSWVLAVLIMCGAFAMFLFWWEQQSRVNAPTVERENASQSSRDIEKSAAIFAQHARTAQKEGRLADALAALEEGLKAAPGQVDLTRLQAEVWKEHEKALSRRREVEKLTVLAESQIAASRYGQAADGNAIDTFRRILELDPANTKAHQRLRQLAELFNRMAQDKQQVGQLERSLSLIDVGLRAEPHSEELRTLREEVSRQLKEEQQQHKLNALLARAEQQLIEFQLTYPRGDNAYESYQAALEIAPGDDRVLSGMRRIADRYAVLALDRKKTGNLRASQDLINKGLGIASDHAGLLDLKETVTAELTAQPPRRGEVDRLLAMAAAQLAASRYVEPEGDNAYETYQRVLSIDPSSQEAKDGLHQIADFYFQQAKESWEAGRSTAALATAAQGLRILPSHPGLQGLSQEIHSALPEQIRRSLKIERLLTVADEQISKGRVVAPPKDNALETYEWILKLDPGNVMARRGLNRVAEHYEALARARLSDGELAQSKELVEEGLRVVPSHRGLLSIKNALETRILEAFPSNP